MEPGAISLHFLFRGKTPPGDRKESSSISSAPHIPIQNELPPPNQELSFEASKQFLSKVELNFKKPPQENLTTNSRVLRALGNTLKFAKDHPFFTAGFILGALLVFAAFPSLSMSFTHFAQIPLGHAELAIGVGLAAMLLSYGITVINIVRKAALKDELEKEIKKHPFSGVSKKELREFSEAEKTRIMNEAKAKESESLLILSETLDRKKELEANQEEQKKVLNELKELQQRLKEKISEETTLSEKEKEPALQLLQHLEQEISTGGALIVELIPPEKIPTLSEVTLEFPTSITPQQENNVKTQSRISEKLKKILPSLVDHVREYPFSTFLSVVGVLFVAIAVPMAVFFLRGDTSIFFLGTLSAVGIVQMAVYGLTMIYEGYNSARIHALKKELQAIEEDIKTQKKIPDERRQITEQANRSLEAFRKEWDSLLLDTRKINEKRIEEIEKRRDKLTIACMKTLLNFTDAAQISRTTLPSDEQLKHSLESVMDYGASRFLSET